MYRNSSTDAYSSSTSLNLSDFAGYKLTRAECDKGTTFTWDQATSTISGKFINADKCTLFFDKDDDIKISSIKIDGVESNTLPTSGVYTLIPECTGATATWNKKDQRLEITDYNSSVVNCQLTYSSVTGAPLFRNYIAGLSGTTQGDGILNDAERGYRYQGNNPNNYVMFNNELWRIIGSFGNTNHTNRWIYRTGLSCKNY